MGPVQLILGGGGSTPLDATRETHLEPWHRAVVPIALPGHDASDPWASTPLQVLGIRPGFPVPPRPELAPLDSGAAPLPVTAQVPPVSIPDVNRPEYLILTGQDFA